MKEIKGKNLSGDSLYDNMFSNLLTGFSAMTSTRQERIVKNTKSKDFEVDTCFANDTNLYETGIIFNKLNFKSWIIVDEYKTKEEAIIGHKKWVKYIKLNPKRLWSIQDEDWIN